jgi:hypothetical protein
VLDELVVIVAEEVLDIFEVAVWTAFLCEVYTLIGHD